jgi:hypothetical protein
LLIVICFLLSNCSNFFFFQSLQQLLVMNQQAKAVSQQATMSTAEALHQTTLTKCFNPPVAAVPASVSGYRMIKIDGQQYLLNDTTNHLLVVPATQKASEKAQSLTIIDLAWDSFGEWVPSAPSISFVTPSAVKKVAKRPPVTTSSNVVLSKNNGSDDKIICVACPRKKRKLVPLPTSQSSKVQVIEQVELNLEVESQDLPKTGHFGDYSNTQVLEDDDDSIGSKAVTGNSSDKAVNLLADSLV